MVVWRSDIHSVKPSPSGTLLAYTVDFEGNEIYSVVVIDLATGKALEGTEDRLPQQAAGGFQWGADNGSLFYLTQDSTQRPYRLVAILNH